MRLLGLAVLCLAAPAYYWLGSLHTPMGGLPIGPLLVALALGLSLLLLLESQVFRIHRSIVSLFVIAALATFLSMVALLTQGATFAQVVNTIGGASGVGVIIAICSYIFANSRLRFGVILGAFLVAVTVSAAVGVGQYVFGDPFYRIWEASGSLPSERVVGSVLGGQVAGLALFSVPLAYQLASAIPIVLALLVTRGAVRGKTRWLLLVVLMVLLVALVFTQIRMALLGVAFAYFLILFLDGRQPFRIRRLLPPLLTVVAVLITVAFIPSDRQSRLYTVGDASAISKVPLALQGIDVALERPVFGARLDYNGVRETIPIRLNFSERVEELVEQNTSHNQFVNVAAFFGIPVLVLVLLFHYLLVRMLIRLRVNNDPFRSAMRMGLLGSLMAYIVVSFAHNAGPFVGDPRIWFPIGLTFALVHLWYPRSNRAQGST